MRKLLLILLLLAAGLISANAQQRKINGTVKDSQTGQFNFDNKKEYDANWSREQLELGSGEYIIMDFLTNKSLGKIEKGQDKISFNVPIADAIMVKLVPSN